MDDPLTLKCSIAGTPEIFVAWFKAEGKLCKSTTCSMDFSNSVATLKLMKTTKFDHGEYICKAENQAGSASTSCNVTVKGASCFPHFLFLMSINPVVVVILFHGLVQGQLICQQQALHACNFFSWTLFLFRFAHCPVMILYTVLPEICEPSLERKYK